MNTLVNITFGVVFLNLTGGYNYATAQKSQKEIHLAVWKEHISTLFLVPTFFQEQ